MISEMFAICSSMITNCNPMTNPMIKKLFKYMTSQRFKKPMTIKKRNKLKSEKGNAQGGMPRKAGAGRNIFISPELDTHTNTHTRILRRDTTGFTNPMTHSLRIPTTTTNTITTTSNGFILFPFGGTTSSKTVTPLSLDRPRDARPFRASPSLAEPGDR